MLNLTRGGATEPRKETHSVRDLAALLKIRLKSGIVSRFAVSHPGVLIGTAAALNAIVVWAMIGSLCSGDQSLMAFFIELGLLACGVMLLVDIGDESSRV